MVADTLGDCRLHCKLHFFTFEKMFFLVTLDVMQEGGPLSTNA